jgi:hypothetical protein
VGWFILGFGLLVLGAATVFTWLYERDSQHDESRPGARMERREEDSHRDDG